LFGSGGFDLFVGIKEFTDVTRNLHCDAGDIFGSRFEVFIKRYGLLDSTNGGKGCGERINLQPLEL
jgi:hypothetical protein